MIKLKNILSLALVCIICISLCACGSSGSSTTVEEKSPEELVRTAVESRGRVEYIGSKIGDKDLKSSHAVITNIASVSDTEYRVSGRMILTDVYGDDWENTFDCTVTQDSSGNWNEDGIEYTSESWTKSN